MDRNKLSISATGQKTGNGITDLKISFEGCAADLLHVVNAIIEEIALSCGRSPGEAVFSFSLTGTRLLAEVSFPQMPEPLWMLRTA